jgi:hypothetical protein
MLDVFVGEAFAARALRQTHAFAKGPIICAAVGAVQMRDRVRAFDADGHRQSMSMMSVGCWWIAVAYLERRNVVLLISDNAEGGEL